MRDLTLLPKAHLHLHFTGSMRVPTVLEMADRHGLHLPEVFRSQWPPELTEAADARGWFRFQRLYDAARACVRSEADMRRIVREAAEDDHAEGSRWLEIQVDPTSYGPFVGGITPALEIVLDEARAVSAEAAAGGPVRVVRAAHGRDQENESPQAQDEPALGLSIVKPCFSMVSAKSIVAPSR